MDIDFSLVLTLAVLITGLLWGFDASALKPIRLRRLQAARAAATQQGASLPAETEQKLVREPWLFETAHSFFPVLAVVWVLRSFLAEPFTIPSGSMLPSLQIGDYVLVNKFAYGVRLPVLGTLVLPVSLPARGDVMVFKFPANVVTVNNKSNKPTWRVTLGYQATPDIYTYANYSRGFKSGGFNDQIGGFAAFASDLDAFREAARATRPETADSFEAGIKTELLDHRLRFNLTGFYVKYKDLQKQLNVPIVVNGNPNQVTLFVNAASATVKGFIVEPGSKVSVSARLRSWLPLRLRRSEGA